MATCQRLGFWGNAIVLSGSKVVLFHGFIKKQQETPKADLDLAIERHKELKRK
jgi:phage-related protein